MKPNPHLRLREILKSEFTVEQRPRTRFCGATGWPTAGDCCPLAIAINTLRRAEHTDDFEATTLSPTIRDITIRYLTDNVRLYKTPVCHVGMAQRK